MTIVYSNEEEGELLTDSQVWQLQVCMAGGGQLEQQYGGDVAS